MRPRAQLAERCASPPIGIVVDLTFRCKSLGNSSPFPLRSWITQDLRHGPTGIFSPLTALVLDRPSFDDISSSRNEHATISHHPITSIHPNSLRTPETPRQKYKSAHPQLSISPSVHPTKQHNKRLPTSHPSAVHYNDRISRRKQYISC